VRSIEPTYPDFRCGPARRIATGIALAVFMTGVAGAGPAAAQAVDEGLVVRRLNFTGNKAFDQEVLAAAIATTGSGWFATSPLVRWVGLGSKRHLNERELRRDVARVRLFYQIHGYLDARVDTTLIRTERDAYITFHVTEGRPILVRTFEITGLDSVPKGRQLVEDLPLQVSAPFDRELLLATADTLVSRLQDRGYPEAGVLLGRREVDRVKRVADVSMEVAPGPPSVIGEIHVEGNRAVDSGFVRSLLATRPGRPFSSLDLAESQRNLYRSELFRYATVALDTASFVAGSGRVPLTIQVTEGTFYRARAAVGYGTNDCFRTGIGWTARNALGNGQIFDASAQVSKLGVGSPTGVDALKHSLCAALTDDTVGSTRANYNVTTSFRRPVFISPANSLTLSLFAERRSEFAVYLRDDIGTAVTLTRETVSRVPVSLAYRFSYGGTEANNVSFCAFFNACTQTDIRQLRQRRIIATLTLGVQRTRVNNPLDPTRGVLLSAEVAHSSILIGSSRLTQFTRFVGEVSSYHPFGSLVLALHARAGMVFAPQVTLQGGATNFVPPEHRFYAGGPSDVRGYNRNELGPLVYVIAETDVRGDSIPENKVRTAATGGNTLLVGNAELRIPSPVLTQRVRLAAFVDAGSVWERGGGPGSGPSIRLTPGVGVRLVTPLGPARFDVAYNGYALPAGRLYLIRASTDLVLLRDDYRRTAAGGKFTLQFGVGHAF
jgi:outer membrane protein assembly complex protein YaeT